MKNKNDNKFTDIVRGAEKKLAGQPMGKGRYGVLTAREYLALYELQAAAVAYCREELLMPLGEMPFSFVYRGHRYGLEYSSLGRCFVCLSPGSDAFLSSGFFALWSIKK